MIMRYGCLHQTQSDPRLLSAAGDRREQDISSHTAVVSHFDIDLELLLKR